MFWRQMFIKLIYLHLFIVLFHKYFSSFITLNCRHSPTTPILVERSTVCVIHWAHICNVMSCKAKWSCYLLYCHRLNSSWPTGLWDSLNSVTSFTQPLCSVSACLVSGSLFLFMKDTVVVTIILIQLNFPTRLLHSFLNTISNSNKSILSPKIS